jgi:oxalate decarboxylase/phosphoglucose isomerase-like protein (cupin superfamily)
MKTTVHYFAGVTATVYQMEAGEKVARHRHPNEHTTAVIAGCSEVHIWHDDNTSPYADRIFRMYPGNSDFILFSNRYHEVQALETPTIVIHMSAVAYVNTADGRMEALPGGVMMEDGTVVPPSTSAQDGS